MPFKQKTLTALFWSSCERFSQQGIQFVITIILARLLAPEEFGLIGMLLIFMAIAQSFVDSGFGQALIQKQDVTYLDECSIFYFNIAVGFLAAGVLYIAAPWIAAFYNQPSLTHITQFLSLNLIFNSFGLIQTTLLSKHINFKILFKVGFGATLVSAIIGVSVAYFGGGVWSLAVQSVSRSFINTALLWLLNTWRPANILSFDSLNQMFGFGSKLLFSSIIDTIFENIYLVIIGKLFSPLVLGCYTQAKNLQHIPVVSICSIVSQVTFPVFSRIQDDLLAFKLILRKSLATLVLIVFPLMCGIAILSRPLVYVVLGDHWLPSVPYVRLLCIVGAFWPLHVLNLNVLKALGRSDLFLRLEVIKKILTVISISITFKWGVEAMLWGQIVTSFMSCYLNSFYTGELLKYSINEQIKDLMPYLVAAAGMGFFVYIGSAFLDNMLAALIAGVACGVVSYFFMCNFFSLAAFKDIVSVLKNEASK